MVSAAAATVLLAAANAAAEVQMPPPFPQLQGRTLSAVLSGTAATSASAGRRQQLHLVEGWRADAVAWATLRSAIATTGFSRLEVQSCPQFDGGLQAFGAGLVEGALTQGYIYNHTASTWPGFFGTELGETPMNISAFVLRSDSWARAQAAMGGQEGGKESPAYWRSVEYALAQLDGLIEGYNRTAPPNQALTRLELLIHNLVGDLGEIVGALDAVPSASEGGINTGARRRKITRCSALVKPTADDIFIAQVDWDDFDVMTKFIKDYTLPFEPEASAATHVRFSSYPGLICECHCPNNLRS
jgi:hypothetical protein